jgi:hypothetical protein
MKMKRYLIILVLIGLGVAWYLFRPEKLFIAKEVNESFPAVKTVNSSQPMVLAQGNFHSVAHDTKGVAAVYKLADGKRVLRFSQFETSNGPAVHVYLVAADDASDNDTVKNAGFVSLGPIKGSKGDQNYDLPTDVDLSKYRAVSVWCERFGVNFGTAPLMMASSTTMASNNQPVVLSEGQFHKVAHDTTGSATIYQLPDGKRVLRFSQFETSNGPAVHVYLVAANDATDNDTVKKAGFLSLGPIKGSKGDQNYELPANTDLAKYRAVTVWCERFGVNFGTAPLMEKSAMMSQKKS